MQFFIAQAQPNSISTFFVFFILAGMGLFLLIVLLLLVFLVRPWLQAFLAATPVSMFHLVAMRLRRSPVQKILAAGIASNQAGHPIAWPDLERAAISGADLSLITQAYGVLRERGEHYSIDELVLAARESRLNKMLS